MILRFYYYIIEVFAEFEARFSRPNDELKFRRRMLRSRGVLFGRKLWVGRGFWLLRSGNLEVGDNVALGEYTRIANHGPIVLGDNFISADGLCINSGSHDPLTMQPESLRVEVGDNVWCGVNVTILGGAQIGNNVVIGACSLVKGFIPSNTVAAGVPAKVLRNLARNEANLWSWVN